MQAIVIRHRLELFVVEGDAFPVAFRPRTVVVQVVVVIIYDDLPRIAVTAAVVGSRRHFLVKSSVPPGPSSGLKECQSWLPEPPKC